MQPVEVFGRRLPGDRDDWLFIGASVLVIVIFSGLLYWDFNRKGGSGSGEVIGKITFKHRTAQRKFAAQVIWDELDAETPLYNRDSIRTAESSEAVITLKNGTKIQLDESTMIVLNITDKSSDIDFAYGSVQAKQDQSGGNKDVAALNIKTQDNKVISIQNSDVKLSKTEGEDLSLTVQRGQANIEANGKKQTVEKDQKAVIAAEIQVRKVVLRPQAPEDGARLFITDAQKPVSFAWEKPQEALTFEIASDRGFSRIVNRVTTAAAGTTVALGDGSYFWRLAAQDKATGRVDYSDFRRITVIRNAPASLVSPIPGARFEYVTQDPLVNFAWSKSDTAQGYVLEIATDPGFASAKRIETSSTAISQRLPAGNYFARITTTSSEAGNLPGPVVPFSVTKLEKTAPPVPIRPSGDRIGRILLEREGLAFAWNVNRDIRNSTLEISASPGFEQTAFKGSTDTNFLAVKQALREGKYYWRVQGIDRNGNATEFSAVSSFTVTEQEKVTLRGPANGTEMDPVRVRQEGIGLLWDGPDLSQFRIIVSPNENLSPAIVNEILATRAYNVRNLAPGRYYWKVFLVSSNGGNLTESETRSFSILDMLEAPQLLEPPRGQTVDMTDKNDLYFRWNPVKGAEGYDFTLFRTYPDGRRQAILNLKTPRADFLLRDLGILDVGGFTWSVAAYGRNQVSEPAFSDFTITLRIDVGKPEILTPGVQYTE